MCGIVGYIGEKNGVEIVLEGLHRLEYRGYDSAGVAVVKNGTLETLRCEGKLKALDEKLERRPLSGPLCIGHTRWATHGAPTEANAHPHLDGQNSIAVVHNGIIENFQEIRKSLSAEGVEFRSDTDTETLAHLIRKYLNGDLFAAVKRALQDVQGAYAIGVVSSESPDVLVGARFGSPLIVGLGKGEAFIASDVPAIVQHTHEVLYIENGQVCEIKVDGYTIHDLQGRSQSLKIEHVEWDDTAADKEGYPHFMLKEIHQQPDVIRNTFTLRVDASSGEVSFSEMKIDPGLLVNTPKITIVACGTAWHAGLVGKHLIERIARVPVEVDVASEFRYREPIIPKDSIVMPVSQSGETADTLEAIRIARESGASVLSIVNVQGSSIARESTAVMHTMAGPEIGVASTKAYTSQIMTFALFSIYLGRLRGTLGKSQAAELLGHLRTIPEKMQWCLDHQDTIQAIAHDPKYRDPQSAFFMGRGYNLPSALEGALKLKEISYIHAEGYSAGEMKHGPIALITDRVPMICIAPQSAVYTKVVSNIQEIRSRQGIVLTIATEGDDNVRQFSDDVIYIPKCYEPFSPLVVAIPLQLIAYHIAVNRGSDVDQPRNLAKSVTVE